VRRVLLQSQSWIAVPLVMLPPVTSRHLPSTRTVPLEATVNCWAAAPLQVASWIAVPLAVLAP